MKKIDKILIAFILLLALTLRLIRLDLAPPHLSNDEISIAYDAYSVSKTLRDEHNNFLPLSFKSHNTYKAPLTIYLTIPTTILFGNNEVSARVPSAILGTLTVLFLGLLLFELTRNKYLGLLSSLILTITPWHIHSSRMALESNIALFFVTLGIYLFVKFINTSKIFFISLSFISFALSIYAYHTEWVFTPLLITLLFVLNFKKLIRQKKYWTGLTLFFVLLIPIITDYFTNLSTTTRANTEAFYNSSYISNLLNQANFNFFQKAQILLMAFLSNYSEYLSLGFLFFSGLNILDKFSPIQLGLFLPILLPFFIIGLGSIKKTFKEHTLFIILWLLMSPLVPALTKDGPSNVRSLVSVLPIIAIISSGIIEAYNFIKYKRLYIVSVSFLISISLFYFVIFYFINFPKQSGENYQYGYKQIAQFIKNNYQSYQTIVIDPKFGALHQYDGLPHLYIPYFTYLDPQKFLNERRVEGRTLLFDKYKQREINWEEEKITKDTLYIVPTSNLPKDTKLQELTEVYEVRLLNNFPAFKLYTD